MRIEQINKCRNWKFNLIHNDSEWFDRVSGFELICCKELNSKSKSEFWKIFSQKKWNKLTSSHDKNMTTIYITNFQKNIQNSSKIIENHRKIFEINIFEIQNH